MDDYKTSKKQTIKNLRLEIEGREVQLRDCRREITRINGEIDLLRRSPAQRITAAEDASRAVIPHLLRQIRAQETYISSLTEHQGRVEERIRETAQPGFVLPQIEENLACYNGDYSPIAVDPVLNWLQRAWHRVSR